MCTHGDVPFEATIGKPTNAVATLDLVVEKVNSVGTATDVGTVPITVGPHVFATALLSTTLAGCTPTTLRLRLGTVDRLVMACRVHARVHTRYEDAVNDRGAGSISTITVARQRS